MKTAREYLEAINDAMRKNPHAQDFYAGRDGSLRLAREFGYGLRDFPESQQREIRGALYGVLVVSPHILRNREVPLDNKEFLAEIDKARR